MRKRNAWLVSSNVSFTSGIEIVSLTLVVHPSNNDCVTIKVYHGADVFFTSTSLVLIFFYYVV